MGARSSDLGAYFLVRLLLPGMKVKPFTFMLMKYWLWMVLLLFPSIAFTQSSGAVVKAGLIWNDYQRDDQTILRKSQVGSIAGLEVRLGAEDNTYFKLGGYYARIHMQSQDHPEETQFFKVVDGYDMIKAICGLETRLLTTQFLSWRLGATAAINFVSDVSGTTRFADINSGFIGLHFNTGVDISIFSIDLALEPGFSDFKKDTEDTKPLMMMLTLGFHF